MSFHDHLPHDPVELELRNLWALEGVWVEWVTNDVLLNPLLELLHKFVVNSLLDIDTRTSTAYDLSTEYSQVSRFVKLTALAMVVEDTKVGPVDGLIDISIVENNVWTLSTKFQSDLLQVAVGSCPHDLPPNWSASSEGNLVNVHVVRYSSSGNFTDTRDNIENSRWETGLLDESCSYQSTKRGLLSSLQDDCVSGRKSRGNLPRKL